MSAYNKNSVVPLSRAVNAAIIDAYEDVSKSREQYTHWGARVLKTLTKQNLKGKKNRVLLAVNHATKTATLPSDFNVEQFVGFIDHHGKRVPLTMNTALINEESVEDVPCEDACEKCNQNKSICNDLEVTESEEVVEVNGQSAVKTTIKKLYPNGDYFLEINNPYWNYVTEAVEFATTKDFIANFDLKDCGCLNNTIENEEKIKCFCPDVYGCYYSSCSNVCDRDLGGYNILPEMGLIQLSHKFRYDKLYIEYTGFLQKVRGQYVLPEVAFEAVVEGIKLKAVKNKPNIPMNTKLYYENNYNNAVGDMRKIMGRIPLQTIINAVTRVPKFDITFDYNNDCCYPTKYSEVSQLKSNVSDNFCQSNGVSCTTSSTGKILTPFQLVVVAGNGENTPVEGENTFYHPDLVGAVNVGNIIVQNSNENKVNDFSFNAEDGILTRNNQWTNGDVLIISYAKFV